MPTYETFSRETQALQSLVDSHLHLGEKQEVVKVAPVKDQIVSIQPANSPSSVLAQKEACCDVDHSQHETFETEIGRWDKIGLFLSSLCALHCLLTPLLVLFLPLMGNIFESEWAHVFMAVFVIPVGLFAFWSGYKHHHQTKVFALGVMGLVLVGGASLMPHEWVEVYEFDVVTLVGSVCLVAAHILNRRACLCHKHA